MNILIKFAVLSFLTLAPITVGAAEPATVPKSQQQAFQLGLVLRLPQARGLIFLEDVKSLDAAPNDIAGKKIVADLDKEAAAFRKYESRSYAVANQLFTVMGAPVMLREWTSQGAKAFDSPIHYSDEAKPYAKSQPAVARILSTIDESEGAAKLMESRQASIKIWLRLSHSNDTLWAARAGDLAATFSQTDPEELRMGHLPAVARELTATAPSGTPTNATDALTAISTLDLVKEQSGTKDKQPDAPDSDGAARVAAASLTLINAFNAQEILAAIEKP